MHRRPSCPRPFRDRATTRATGLGVLLLLGGCHYASSPLVGFGGFIGDTHTFSRNPNLPAGHDENTLFSQGRNVTLDPLLPEGGNVWPGPPAPIPTLTDIEKQQNQFEPGNPTFPPGSSIAPAPAPQFPREASPAPPPATFAPPSTQPRPSSPPVITTPSGPLINNGPIGVPGGASSAGSPNGGTSIVVPNGNGTSTVIAPDGSTSTIPTPK